MGIGKPQWLAKFEVADFICYGNMTEFVSKNSDKPKWKNPLLLEKLTLTLDSHTQCFLFDVQLLWSYDYSKRAIFTKNCILQWKIFAPESQKAHPYAKSGRTNRLAYVAVTLF